MAKKAIDQVHHTVNHLLVEHLEPRKADQLARMLSEGRWTHDYPIDVDQAKAMGLPVDDQMPGVVYQLMDLFPQSRQQRPTVEYIPTPYRPTPTAPGKGEK